MGGSEDRPARKRYFSAFSVSFVVRFDGKDLLLCVLCGLCVDRCHVEFVSTRHAAQQRHGLTRSQYGIERRVRDVADQFRVVVIDDTRPGPHTRGKPRDVGRERVVAVPGSLADHVHDRGGRRRRKPTEQRFSNAVACAHPAVRDDEMFGRWPKASCEEAAAKLVEVRPEVPGVGERLRVEPVGHDNLHVVRTALPGLHIAERCQPSNRRIVQCLSGGRVEDVILAIAAARFDRNR